MAEDSKQKATMVIPEKLKIALHRMKKKKKNAKIKVPV